MSKMGEMLRQERERRGLKRHQLAAMIGYRNLDKGARKVASVEQRGGDEGGVRTKMIRAMGLEETAPEAIAADIEARRDAFEKWVNTPVPPKMIVRLIPAFYVGHPIPEELHGSPAEMERFACGFAAEKRRQVCLQLSRQSIWIDETGRVYSRSEATPEAPFNGPMMRVR